MASIPLLKQKYIFNKFKIKIYNNFSLSYFKQNKYTIDYIRKKVNRFLLLSLKFVFQYLTIYNKLFTVTYFKQVENL